MTQASQNSLFIYSDMHKDAYGFRPCGEFQNTTEEKLRNEMDLLEKTIFMNEERERINHLFTLNSKKAHLKQMAKDFNISMETALRWDMEAIKAFDYQDSFEYYCYENGISCDIKENDLLY